MGDGPTLTFLGGAGTVTGSKYLVRAGGRQVLLDCGRWLAGFSRAPERVWMVHGEPPAARALAAAITERFGWRADVAVDHARVSLGADR
jgi:Cft2 family RNA processing exonuclease